MDNKSRMTTAQAIVRFFDHQYVSMEGFFTIFCKWLDRNNKDS